MVCMFGLHIGYLWGVSLEQSKTESPQIAVRMAQVVIGTSVGLDGWERVCSEGAHDCTVGETMCSQEEGAYGETRLPR